MMRGRVLGVVTLLAVAALCLLPSGSSAAFDAKLKRYPYLTDLVGTSVMVNFGTDISSTSATVKYGPVGGTCDTSAVTATRTFILVNGISEYQWKAQIAGLAANTQYCYRLFFGSGQLDLLGTDASPVFTTQMPAGSSAPFKFAVFGDWGKTLAAGNPNQANVISQIAQSGARFAVTTGDNAYESGSQKDYGDLYQVGDNTSAVFGPNYWKVAGASLPLFPALGNHDYNNSILLTNWPQDTAVATSSGRYQTDTYCCQNGTTSANYPSGWYAFDAGLARFYVLTTAWDDTNSGTATPFKNDFDNHWGPNSPQYQWLANDLANNPRALRFAFWHYPLKSDSSESGPDTYLQGANSLEGLLKLYDVTAGFNGHAHNYQRHTAPSGGIPTHITGGGGANLESVGANGGCGATDAYGVGWSNQSNVGSACGAGPVPATKDRVHHFLSVSVSGTSVTVTPTDELGRTFDPITYNAPAQNANLSITNADSPDPVLVGQQVTYNLTVGNAGPRAATGTVVTDTLPAGMIFDSATPSQGMCSQTSGTVTCQLGTVGNGATPTIQIKGRPQSTGSISNTATVASNVNDPSTGNNSASASTTVNPAADLALTKTDTPDPAAVGSQLTYNVSVSNAGPSSATGITITDTLPAGVTFNSATPTQGSCSQASGTVTCSLGTLANTASASVAINVTPQNVATITNQANVTSLTGDPNTANNGASAETTVTASANLSLTKSDAPDPVLVGQLLTYTLTVANAGPSGATGVTLTDTLPSGVTFDSATPSQGTCTESSGTVTCDLGTIANAGNASASIKIRPQSQGSITNTASVTSAAADTNLANNSASATTTVDPVADLAVTKSDSPDPVLVGQELTYTVGVQNTGPSAAPGVSMSDTLPAGVTFTSATPSQGTCSQSAGTVTCPLGTIANGASASVQIKVTPQSTGSITNQASAASSISDPNSANNTASAATTVSPAANLSLTKSDSPDPVLQGQQLTYTLGVSNAGPSSATGVSLSDTLPSGVTFDSATPSQGTCSQSAGTVTCPLGTIANGVSASVQIKVTPQSAGSITNNASVSSDVADPVPANNSASATTTVDPVADLAITKSDSPDPVASGQQLTYTLGISNAGPSGAAGVLVSDTLPSGVTFGSATPSQGSCSQAAGTVTCTLGTIASGASASVTINVTPSSGGTITNQASVSAATADPVLVNNSASASTTVDPVADLSLTKTDSPDPVLSGQRLTYTLLAHNAGPAGAPSVSLSDALPGGVTFVSATPTQGGCVRIGSTVTCALGTIASGADATVEIKVDTGAPGSITNEAVVVSTATDPNPADNSSSTTTTVKPVSDLGLTKTDSPDPVLAGELLTYTLGVSNAGPHGAAGVTLVDDLPNNADFDSATPSQGSCSESAGTVTCALGTVADAGSASVEIKVRPHIEGSVTNEASVSSDSGDLNQSNNSAGATTTVEPAADLELTKTDSPDPVLSGQELTYTLTVHNAGPSSTGGVALSDTLPAGVTFQSVTTNQGSCFRSGSTVLCSLGTFADNSTATIEIKVIANAVGTLTNIANVLGMTVDPDTADNGASADTTVLAAANLSLTKSDSPDPVQAGQQLTYTLGVQNAGPQAATGVSVTDTLPAGVQFESATPSQGTCSEASGTVTCALGTIANGAGASVEVKVRPQNGGEITNQASVASDQADPSPAGNSASESTTVQPVADLSLTKSDAPDPVLAGELITYTLSVHNAGPSSATAVQVTDNLPAGAAFDSATPSQGSCTEAAGIVTCALGTLAYDGDATIEIKVRQPNPGTSTNQASVSTTVSDPNSANDSASTDTTVDPAADLSLTKSDSPDPVMEGEQLTYTLTVANSGPQDAPAVQLTDTLPAGVTFDSATPSQGTCAESAGTVTCELGTVANGASADVQINVTPQGPGTITNQATVTSGVADPDSGDRSASAETTVDPVADLALTKSDAPDPVLAGAPLTYTLTVANSGPRDATNVVLADTLPATAVFDSATPSQGTCSQASGTVTCAFGTIPDAGTASAEIVVTPQEGGTITNEATLSSDQRDPTAGDRSASAETTVDPAADLELTKSDAPDPVLAGELLTYTLSVHNAGPSSAAAVQLTDTLPAGVNFDSATPSQGTCSEASGTVDCGLGTIADEATATVVIKVRPQEPGTITNQASVVALALDADTADNNASAETTVVAAADLSLTKSGSPDPVLLGGTLTYDLTVQNSGPQSATGVQVTDTLPAEVSFDSATPSQGTCSEASGTVTCALGTLADAESATVQILVTALSTGTIANQASVTSEVADPDAGDATAGTSTTVDPVADLLLTKTDTPDPAIAGEPLTYTVTVDNSGPSDAAGVVVTDDLPNDVTYGSATPSQGTCSESGGTVTCALGTIANAASASVDIAVTPQSPGSVTNDASVVSDAHDPVSGNNSATAVTEVSAIADLSLTKSDAPDPAVANELLTYTLSVHNAGPSGATSVSLTDTLPAGVTYLAAVPSQGTCSQSAGTVTCTLGTVASGAGATVTVKIRAPSAGTITNQASVSSSAGDPNSADNTASAQTQINAAVFYPRPKGATPLRVPLVPAYSQCTSPNAIHGPALEHPSCKPPARVSNYLTIGTPDANGAVANSSGFVRLATVINTTPTPNDVLISANITDVRCGAGVSTCAAANTVGGPDYTGELEVTYGLRLTDRRSGAGGGVAATVEDTSFPAAMACAATAGTTIGASCAVSTTANALLPGMVISGSRTLWQIGQVDVYDGGADGVASTAGNGLFATQGILVP